MQTAGDAAGAKAKKTRKKVKQPREDAAKDEHVQQAAHPHSEEREADGLPEPRSVLFYHTTVVVHREIIPIVSIIVQSER